MAALSVPIPSSRFLLFVYFPTTCRRRRRTRPWGGVVHYAPSPILTEWAHHEGELTARSIDRVKSIDKARDSRSSGLASIQLLLYSIGSTVIPYHRSAQSSSSRKRHSTAVLSSLCLQNRNEFNEHNLLSILGDASSQDRSELLFSSWPHLRFRRYSFSPAPVFAGYRCAISTTLLDNRRASAVPGRLSNGTCPTLPSIAPRLK